MLQSGLSIVSEILPEKVETLRSLLNEIGNDINGNPYIVFPSLRTVHFLRFVILDSTELKGKAIPPQLVLSTNFDGSEKAHLLELGTQAQQGFIQIYQHCKNFPKDPSPQQIADYLSRFKRKNAAFYLGAMGRSVRQIEQEAALYDAIQEFLQESYPAQNWEGKTAMEIRAEIQEFILAQDRFSWAEETYQKPFLQTFGTYVLLGGLLAVFFLTGVLWTLSWHIMVVLTCLGVLLAGIFWIRLKRMEEQDAKAFQPAIKSVDQLAKLMLREDYKIQNQITHLVDIKPGYTRQIALRCVLWAINLLAGVLFNKGELAGIVSIHFARWVIIDDGKRLLFFSNYDGSWESYLGEFVDRAAIGLTGIWSNTAGFPPTQNLVKKGATNSVEFKSWAREKQLESQIWYSARVTLSVKNINNNTAIRQGLLGQMDEKQAQEWLKRL